MAAGELKFRLSATKKGIALQSLFYCQLNHVNDCTL